MTDRTTYELLNKDYSKVERLRLKMVQTLMGAIDECGGCSDSIMNKIINNDMSVLELIDLLGQNHVEFIYVGTR